MGREPRGTAPGVEDAVGVERVLHPAGQRHHVLAELGGQRRLLRAPHAVLAGDGAVEPDRGVHDLVEGDQRAHLRLVVAARHHDQRVGVAVPGVRHDGDEEVVARGDARHRVDELGQARHRHARRPPASARRAPRPRGSPSGAPARTARPPRRRR